MRTDEAAVIAAGLGVLAGGASGVHPPVEHRRTSTLHIVKSLSPAGRNVDVENSASSVRSLATSRALMASVPLSSTSTEPVTSSWS